MSFYLIINSFLVIIPQSPQLPAKNYSQRHIKTEVVDDDFGAHASEGSVLNFTFVDSKHPEFESKHGKV